MIGKPARKLSVVGTQQRSTVASAKTEVAETPLQKNQRQMAEITAARRAKQDAGMDKARAARKVKTDAGQALKAAGVKSPVQRYKDGEYPCTAWDDDEVSKGRPRDINGSFASGYPSMTGRQHAEIKRELLRRGQRQMDENLGLALDTLAQIAKHGESESARVKAATILMERAAGKVPDKIEIKSSDPWQDILDEVMDDAVLERMSTDMPVNVED